MTIIRSISLTEEQDKWLKKNRISISKFVQSKIMEEMKCKGSERS